jgi:hypothetical protein
MATLKANGTQHQQQAPAPSNNTTSPDSAAAAVMAPNGTSPGRNKLKLHFKGLKGVPAVAGGQQPPPQPPRDPQQQQQQQRVAAAAGRPPAAPGRLSVPPSPSQQLQPAGDSGGLLSPDSAGGPSPGGRDWSAVLAKAEENAAKRSISRIPEGQVGAGLPVIQGGPGEWGCWDDALRRGEHGWGKLWGCMSGVCSDVKHRCVR